MTNSLTVFLTGKGGIKHVVDEYARKIHEPDRMREPRGDRTTGMCHQRAGVLGGCAQERPDDGAAQLRRATAQVVSQIHRTGEF